MTEHEKLARSEYEFVKAGLQKELLKAQRHAIETKQRFVILFEGRDAAGKGGTIKRFTEHLNPRYARVVALQKPNRTEKGQWYFQRYIRHLPTSGEIVLFDRSWYNRAGVELVMGFCSQDEHERFLGQVNLFERMLQQDGIQLFKYWFSVSREEQLRRFKARQEDELKQWKISDVDMASIDKWPDYTAAKENMFARTHTYHSPWVVIKSDDKKRARINCMRHFLTAIDYPDKDLFYIAQIDEGIISAPPTQITNGRKKASGIELVDDLVDPLEDKLT